MEVTSTGFIKGINNNKEFLMWEKASRDTIDFKTIYVDITGDLIAGLLLSQIMYWYLPDKEGLSKLRVKKGGQYCLAKKRSDWWGEIRISQKQYDRAIKILKDKKFVNVTVHRFDGIPVPHIVLNMNAVREALNEEIKRQLCLSLQKGESRLLPKVKNEIDQRVKSLTESTTENTSENTKIAKPRKFKSKEECDEIRRLRDEYLNSLNLKPVV